MFYAFDGEHTSMSLGAELEQSLLSAPWQLKTDPHDHLWLIKYAPHPSKPGYVFLATDLDRVLYEALTSPAILYRLEEVREALGLSNGAEEGDIKSQTESALSSLGRVFGGAWDQTKLEVKKHDYHDAIFELRHSTFSWQFFTSEIKGRQPLHILAKHLVVPLIGLSHPSAVQKPPDGVQDVLAILESTDILKELAASTSQAKAEPSTSHSPVPSTSKSKEEEELVPSSSPVPEEPADQDDGDEEEYRSPSATPTPTPQSASHATTSKTPRSARKTAKSPEDGADNEDSPPPRTLGVGKRRQPSPDPSGSRATSTASASVPPSRASKAPSPEKKKKHETPAESSTSPPPEPPRPSQKAKREKEKEEEEALEKRREEMKRKMARGGGGRLGARRGRL